MSSFPVIRNVWAVGRNYGEHAKELGNAVPGADSEPLIFLKAGSSVVTDASDFHLPAFSKDVHHELEVAFRFGAGLKLSEVTVSIDLTARDIQNKLKAQGQPWTLAKSFKEACLVGPLKPFTGDFENIEFTLKVNGELRQSGNTRDMIHSVEKVRRYVVERFPVVEGDLLLTGTPAGVAAIASKALLEAEIPGLVKASWRAV